MMDTNNNSDLFNHIKHLLAENASLKERLNDYQNNISIKEKEIQELRLQIASNNQIKSQLDNQLIAVEILQNYMDGLGGELPGDDKAAINVQHKDGSSVLIKHQMENIKKRYTYMQTKYTDQQIQLTALNARNLLLQQQASRVAALESLLADAEQEIAEWKMLAAVKE